MGQGNLIAENNPFLLVLGGGNGLLGQAAAKVLADEGFRVAVEGLESVDSASRDSLRALLERWQPECVVNAVACNSAETAERSPEAAYALNARLPENLAEAVRRSGTYLVHFSSDLVFDGEKRAPYIPGDRTNPACVLGASKLAGERSIAETAPESALIIRTSWLFGPWKTNFVQQLLDRARTERIIPVAHDAIGSPTYTLDLAYYASLLIRHRAVGTYHLTNSGRASWCELAAEALAATEYAAKVEPITSEPEPQRAMRPRYHVLDTSDFTRMVRLKPRPWLQALREYMFRFEAERLWGDPVGVA